MKIAIDALGISQPGGGRSATLNLLEPLLAMDQDTEYILFLDSPEPSLQRPNVRHILAPFHGRFRSRLWAQLTWPSLLRREGVQLIHHTKNLVTIGNPCPSLVTVFDLTILNHPDIYPMIDVLYWRTVEKGILRRVKHIITISQATADDLNRFYGISTVKMTVIPAQIAPQFSPICATETTRVRKQFDLPEHYLLHVGSISPKKNLGTLVRAYGQLRKAKRYEGSLVLVGRTYFQDGDRDLEQAIAETSLYGPILRTGPVPQEDLPAIMSGADCFVFPSLHEGFGLVPLEAMACGVPVIAARSSAIEEVLGEAAILIDEPRAVDVFAERINELLTNTVLRNSIVSAGLKRASLFSRERAARQTLTLYYDLIKQAEELANAKRTN
jgi:glycosyltransferase involved in cell wall biosynthesis